MNDTRRGLAASYRVVCTRILICAQGHVTAFLLMLGFVLLAGGIVELTAAQAGGPSGSFSEASFDDELIRHSVGNLFKLIEGAFGALVMVVAGVMAIVAAAMGQYRAALGMLVVAVGAFILRALVSLFFGTDYSDFEI